MTVPVGDRLHELPANSDSLFMTPVLVSASTAVKSSQKSHRAKTT